MPKRESNRSGDRHFPPDLAAVLGPMLAGIVFVYVTGAISLAKAIGDMSLFHLALWLGGMGLALLFLARMPLDRRGYFFTLRPRSLTGWHRRFYYAAYAFIIPRVALLGLLLMSLT